MYNRHHPLENLEIALKRVPAFDPYEHGGERPVLNDK